MYPGIQNFLQENVLWQLQFATTIIVYMSSKFRTLINLLILFYALLVFTHLLLQ